MATIDDDLAYAEERKFDLVEYEPKDMTADRRALMLVAGDDGRQLLVSVGWGAGGLYADVRIYFEGEPVTPVVFDMGDSVSIQSPSD